MMALLFFARYPPQFGYECEMVSIRTSSDYGMPRSPWRDELLSNLLGFAAGIKVPVREVTYACPNSDMNRIEIPRVMSRKPAFFLLASAIEEDGVNKGFQPEK
ncbi:MAG: hypothetical protein OEU60_13800 [Gammaproteobacteria bacterium]|nr:hypothetical protein [Gammaproteobacteria bacterium]